MLDRNNLNTRYIFSKISVLLVFFIIMQSCVTTNMGIDESGRDSKGSKKTFYSNYDKRVTNHFLKALNYKELGNVYGAIVEFQNAYKINNDGYIQKEIAECYILLKQYVNALIAIDITLDKLGNDEVEYLLLKLKILNFIEDWNPKSAGVIEILIKSSGTDIEKKFSYYSLLMELYYRTKNFESLFSIVDRAIFEENFDNDKKRDLLMRKAAFSIVSKNYLLAKGSYLYYLDNIDGKDVEILKRLNEIYLIERDFDSFLKKQEIILKVDSLNVFNFNQYYFVLEEMGQKDKAFSFLKKAILKFPKDYTLNYSLGRSYIDKNDTTKARKVLFSILKNDSTDIPVYNELAMMYDSAGDKNQAVNMYEIAYNLKDDDVTVLNNYAYILSEMNVDLDKALKMSKKTLSLAKNVSSYLDTYAWILYRLEKYSEAEIYLRKAITYNVDKKQLYILYEHLAGVLDKLNRLDEAMEEMIKSNKARERYNK